MIRVPESLSTVRNNHVLESGDQGFVSVAHSTLHIAVNPINLCSDCWRIRFCFADVVPYKCLLPPLKKEVVFSSVCLSVCLSVRPLTEKVVNGF